jgi:putative DNA primase/helicase
MDEVPTLRLVHPQKQFDDTDCGNAERLVHHFAGTFHYVEEWDEFVVWNGTFWERDPRRTRMGSLAKKISSHIKAEAKALGIATDNGKRIYAWAKQSRQNARVSAMIHLVRSERGIAISHKLLDVHGWKLCCRNTTIDLKTGDMKLHDLRDLNTKAIDTRYDKKAKAPLWEAFLEQVIPDVAVRHFIQKYIGYCLTADVGERTFVVFYGGGKNGKSVFLRVTQALLGTYATTCAPGLLMAQKNEAHPTEIADLFGVRLAVASEVKKGRSFDEEKVKKLTGGDVLKARRMQEDFWQFDPTHKILLATNHKPRVTDATDSFWDRLALVEFGVRIQKVDRTLGERIIKKELSGVLAWAVEGCLAWQKEGLEQPKSVKHATLEYRGAEDVIGAFFDECCELLPTAWTPTSTILASVEKWCALNTRFALSRRDVTEWLSQHDCSPKRNTKGTVRGWTGVHMKPEAS